LSRGKDRSPKEVAALLGVTVESVRAWIHAGEFPGAWQCGALMRVPEEAIEHFRAHHAKFPVERNAAEPR
jgi:excisionase family DNA binding protein